MKTNILYTLLFTICIMPLTYAQWGKGTKGSGNIISKTVNTSDYDAINVTGSMDVTLTKGKEGSIKIETDDNIMDLVEISTEGAILKITMKNNSNYYSKHGIKIFVPFMDLNEISFVGSGDVRSNDLIEASTFTCSFRGSGDFKAEVSATNIDANFKGSGNVKLSGNTNQLTLEMSGSGDFDASKLTSQQTDVSLRGSGDADVNAQQSIKARLSGSGDITYSGNPASKDVNVKGSRDIDAKN